MHLQVYSPDCNWDLCASNWNVFAEQSTHQFSFILCRSNSSWSWGLVLYADDTCDIFGRIWASCCREGDLVGTSHPTDTFWRTKFAPRRRLGQTWSHLRVYSERKLDNPPRSLIHHLPFFIVWLRIKLSPSSGVWRCWSLPTEGWSWHNIQIILIHHAWRLALSRSTCVNFLCTINVQIIWLTVWRIIRIWVILQVWTMHNVFSNLLHVSNCFLYIFCVQNLNNFRVILHFEKLHVWKQGHPNLWCGNHDIKKEAHLGVFPCIIHSSKSMGHSLATEAREGEACQ